MFTGIVKYLAKVVEINESLNGVTIAVDCESLKDYSLGGSIMVNGVCLTLTKVEANYLYFDVIPETLKVTNLGSLDLGDMVNLESSLTLASYMDGHLVSGHIDFMTNLKEINKDNEYYFELPLNYAKYFALKGSVTINGVSLTISELDSNSFKVSLIPATLKETNLQFLGIGDFVNVEVDIVARYLDRLKNF